MTPDRVFAVVSQLAMLTWLLLLVFPRRHVVVTTIAGGVTPVLFAVIYVVVIASFWGSSEGGFSSLAGVKALFSNDWLLLAGWIHYLGFDLLVGRWELLDSQTHRIPHLGVVPCLLLTFVFGPGGWLLYLVLRVTWVRRGAAGPS
jgi:uncharacterized membrane protein YkvI